MVAGRLNMDKQGFVSILKVLGLKVTEGLVKDREGYIYGYLEPACLKAVNDTRYAYTEIDSPGMTYQTHQLTLNFTDGTDAVVNGTQLIDVAQFVGQSTAPRKVPKTVKQLNDVLPMLYPDIETQLYYDALNEREMIDMKMLDRPNNAGGYDIVPIDDKVLDLLQENIEAKLIDNNFEGTKMPTKELIISVINIRTFDHQRNEFRDWVSSLHWDGKPRVRRWLKDFFGATAPALAPLGLEDMYLEEVSQAWLIGAIARNFPVRDGTGVLVKNIKHEIVPVLIGAQGIGKGTALRMTAGKDAWYVETTESVKDTAKFLDGVRGHIIVELSETTQIRSADAETLKGFISKGTDQMRKPYGRYSADYPRHFIFAASTNLSTVFTDITGNRRFFPMYCDPSKATIEFSDNRSRGQYDVEQMWAEALQLFNEGNEWKISPIVNELAGIMQEFSAVENSNVELIDGWLDDFSNGYAERGAKISKRVIMEGVFHLSEHDYIPKEAENAYRAWSNGTKSWNKIQSTIRVGGKPDRGFERVLMPGEIRPVLRLGMKKNEYDLDVWTPALKKLMYARAKPFEYKDIGDLFPVIGIPPSVLMMLLDNGYIYEEKTGAEAVVYRVGYMPSEEELE